VQLHRTFAEELQNGLAATVGAIKSCVYKHTPATVGAIKSCVYKHTPATVRAIKSCVYKRQWGWSASTQ